MFVRTDGDLCVGGTGLFLDSTRERDLCFVSHAHSDHICIHKQTIATPATLAFCRHRLGEHNGSSIAIEYDQPHALGSGQYLRLLPAGHVHGSSMLHLSSAGGSLLYTGDFRLRADSLTVAPARPELADYLLMETTYGDAMFRFPPRAVVMEQLIELVSQAFVANRQPIVFGYSLGKAQELTRILTDAGFNITAHGAVQKMSDLHREMGVNVGPSRRYMPEDFHGQRALDLRERGVLLAPAHTPRSAFVTRFENPCRIMMSGWALSSGAIYRYGVDHALPLSDHADIDELFELVERVQPRKVFTHHGGTRFASLLRDRGIDAEAMQEQQQLELFG